MYNIAFFFICTEYMKLYISNHRYQNSTYFNVCHFDRIKLLLQLRRLGTSTKEYATIAAIMAYWNLTTIRIKVDRIFNGLNYIRGKHSCLK